MKTFFSIAGFILSMGSGNILSQENMNFTGTWEGILHAGVQVRILMHIKAEPDGSFSSVTDSPNQSVYGIKADRTIIDKNTLFFEVKKLMASFSGILENDSTISGTLKQGKDFPLIFRKKLASDSQKALERKSQTPTPPFSYYSDSVEYYNADKTMNYGATITYPRSDGKFPGVVLVTGSGPQDRDETIGLHKPFAVIADHLTRKGYIVLRVDDRGTGKTTGDFLKANSLDFAKDVEAGINYLQTRKEIDLNKIGLIGHSEGGMIASMVASERTDIAFIIMLAGPGVKNIDLMTEQNGAFLKKYGISKRAIEAYKPLYKKIVLTIIESPDSMVAGKKAQSVLDDWLGKTGKALTEEMGFKTLKKEEEYITSLVQQLYTPWFRYFLKYDPGPSLKKLLCPVLVMNGDKDIQVISKQNLPGIEKALKKSKVKNYEIKELPGLNHLFQSCNKCTVEEYITLDETFSTDALLLMSDWLKKMFSR